MSDITYWNNRWTECVLRNWQFDTVKTWTPEQVANETKFLWGKAEPFIKGALSVVDFGCGKGRFFQYFKRAGIEYVGYDPCAQAVAYCSALYGDKFTGIFPEGKHDLFFAVTSMQYVDDMEAVTVFSLIREFGRFVIIESLGADPVQDKYSHDFDQLSDTFKIKDELFIGMERYRLIYGVRK